MARRQDREKDEAYRAYKEAEAMQKALHFLRRMIYYA
jgi:hypothetical protein